MYNMYVPPGGLSSNKLYLLQSDVSCLSAWLQAAARVLAQSHPERGEYWMLSWI